MNGSIGQRHRHSVGVLLVSVIFCAGVSSEVNAQKTSFPGRPLKVESPDGRYVIRNSDNLHESPAHTLTLLDKNNNSATKIYMYARHVDVLWSPNSDSFIINDYEGSDSARPVLCLVPWTGNKTDLLKQLLELLRARGEQNFVLQNGHVYFTASKWLNKEEILCRLDGYGDANPKGFTRYYIYRLGTGFRAARPQR